MLDLHREKTRTSTQEQSRRVEELTLQSGAKLAPGLGGRLGVLANHSQPHGSYLHRL